MIIYPRVLLWAVLLFTESTSLYTGEQTRWFVVKHPKSLQDCATIAWLISMWQAHFTLEAMLVWFSSVCGAEVRVVIWHTSRRISYGSDWTAPAEMSAAAIWIIASCSLLSKPYLEKWLHDRVHQQYIAGNYTWLHALISLTSVVVCPVLSVN